MLIPSAAISVACHDPCSHTEMGKKLGSVAVGIPRDQPAYGFFQAIVGIVGTQAPAGPPVPGFPPAPAVPPVPVVPPAPVVPALPAAPPLPLGVPPLAPPVAVAPPPVPDDPQPTEHRRPASRRRDLSFMIDSPSRPGRADGPPWSWQSGRRSRD